MAGQLPIVDHTGMTVMPFATCLSRLRATPVGRVAFAQNGDIEVLPVNYQMLDTAVVFRTAEGSKLGAALQGKAVAFEIDEFDLTRRAGWSVLLQGRADLVADETTLRALDSIGLAPWPAGIARPEWVLIHADTVSGRCTSNW
jgi:nitroimidazol reductase NimA-like FMN-containing flavoprotein (pyridoxamine 5'-phosphate oxidase superfamily)